MKKTFNKKRFWWGVFILVAVEVVVCCVVIQKNSSVVSELYTRYENVEGIDVSFIKDYKVNDTVFVDVTVLEATDSTGWSVLQKEFKLSGYHSNEHNEATKDITYRYAPKNEYSQCTDTTNILNNDCVATNYTDNIICVFHIVDEKSRIAISNIVFQHMINKKQFKFNTKQK